MSSNCDFCGLPLPGAAGAGGAPEETGQYCCFGCRFAAAVTRERGESGAVRWTLARLGISLFLSMNVMAFTMALWSADVYGQEAAQGALAGSLQSLFRYLCLVFSLPVLVLLGRPLFENAWQALRRGVLSTDLLLLSGVLAAFVVSAVSVVRDAGHIYFEVACVILVMVTLGRWFEAAGRLKAGAALDELQKLIPDHVRAVRDGAEIRLETRAIRPRERLRVLPGERFPVDGVLVANSTSVDEQILTGESRPVTRKLGEPIYAGTLNLDGDVLVETSVLPGAGTLDRLIGLVRQAREARGHYHELADRISAWAFPAVAAIALTAFGWHWYSSGLESGLMSGLAVVLVACPCALGLATPLAVWAALGVAAGRQVLFRNGQALERLAGIRAIRFDKTGTLTTGEVCVTDFLMEPGMDPAARAATFRDAALLAGSTLHPFSRAIVAACEVFCEPEAVTLHSPLPHSRFRSRPRTPVSYSALTTKGGGAGSVHQVAGRGICGPVVAGHEPVYLGNRSFMDDFGLVMPEALLERTGQGSAAHCSVSYFGSRGRVRAAFVFEEDLRESAVPALNWCREQALDVAVLTGDRQSRAAALASDLGVPVLAELSPEQKLSEIHEARRRFGPVAMVGDGVNDAPALAASDVGIALGCGTDVSRDSAGVCLLGNDLERLTWAVEFARDTVRVMRRNLLWAFGYNSVGIALAAAGSLNPALAALLMVVSSALVIRNSLSLSRAVEPQQPRIRATTQSSGREPYPRAIANDRLTEIAPASLVINH